MSEPEGSKVNENGTGQTEEASKRGPSRSLVVAIVAVVVAAVLLAVVLAQCAGRDGRGSAVGASSSGEPVEGGETLGSSKTPAPTWDMTAHPVPNDKGSTGFTDPDEAAQKFVERNFAWEPDVQMPEWHLSMVRDYTTDPYFAQLVAEKQNAPEWEQLHKDVKERDVKVISVEQSKGEMTFLQTHFDVTYQLIDTHKDGSITRSENRVIGVRMEAVKIEDKHGTSVETIKEPRVAETHDGPYELDGN